MSTNPYESPQTADRGERPWRRQRARWYRFLYLGWVLAGVSVVASYLWPVLINVGKFEVTPPVYDAFGIVALCVGIFGLVIAFIAGLALGRIRTTK